MIQTEVLSSLKKTFNDNLILDLDGKYIEYTHPNWVLPNYFDSLRDSLSASEYRQIAHYGDRFFGQFVLGNNPEEFKQETWMAVVNKLSLFQKKLHIKKGDLEKYQSYRDLFQKQKVFDVINKDYLDLIIKELAPEFYLNKDTTLGNTKFRYTFFNTDFSACYKKRYLQYIFQKYYLKTFLNFVAKH